MKKILFLFILALGFVSCSQDENIEQVSAITRSIPNGAFTGLEEYSGGSYKELAAEITCLEASSVTFTIALHYPSGSRFSGSFYIGGSGFSLNQSTIQDVTVNLPKGTSNVSVQLNRNTTTSIGGYARMFIKEVNSGSVAGYAGGYDDLTVDM